MYVANEVESSFALRYQVYCKERNFLSASLFNDARENDEFDDNSLHFGSFDPDGRLAGTARLVLNGPRGLPMFRHCRIDPEWRPRIERMNRLCEISRLAVSRSFPMRQRSAGFTAWQLRGGAADAPEPAGAPRRSMIMSLFAAMYDAGHGIGITHAVMAMERSLHRLLCRFRLPIERIGPDSDYYGLVNPYLLDIAALDLAHDLPRSMLN